MAKTIKVNSSVTLENNVAAVNAFQPAAVSTQVGDKFYVPTKEMIVITGTKPTTPTANGPQVFGQRFAAVVLDGNGKPEAVRELYVGQIVKTNVRGSYVFPENDLVKAYRRSPDAFANAVCGHILTVSDEKEIDDRSWDREKNAYRRDPETRAFLSEKRRALEFNATTPNFTRADVEKANELLLEFYAENYKDIVSIEG